MYHDNIGLNLIKKISPNLTGKPRTLHIADGVPIKIRRLYYDWDAKCSESHFTHTSLDL